MNALVKKEIRLLLPNFGFACVLALAGISIPNNDGNNFIFPITYILSCIFCPAASVMLALSSFGVEIGSGTFSNLLAQPVSRLKIWETKIALLAVALLAVAFLWVASFLISTFHSGANHGVNDWLDLFSVVIVFGLVIFSGGLWTVLLLRQVAAAFWFALLIPGALLVIPAALFSEHDGNLFEGVIVCILGLYSLAGFFFARWLFFRAQDLQWSGGNIVMPELRGLARWQSAAGRLRQWRPRAALWRKEIMLHQSQLVMAFVLAVLHGSVLVARQFVDKFKSPDLYFVLQIFWGLWLVMPVLIGCAAVAEERKLGTHEGQLCLPVRRRTQFGIKLVTALALSLLLGLAGPLLFEGTRILPAVYFGSGSLENTVSSGSQYFSIALGMLNSMLPLLTLALIVVGFFGVAFYVSTLSRNTLQSLAPTVLGIVVLWGLILLAVVPWDRMYHLHGLWWSGPLPYLIGGPLLVLAVLVLMAGNFNQAQPTLKLAGKNLGVLLAAILLSAGATSAIYHRLWEKLTPLEPAHGPAKITRAEKTALAAEWWGISVRLPNGRFWLVELWRDPKSNKPLDLLLGNLKIALNSEHSIAGSNWLTAQRASHEIAGIKTDGSLWVSEKPRQEVRSPDGKWKVHDEGMWRLTRFGNETNWVSMGRLGMGLVLVKKDGTLWKWGPSNFDGKTNWPGLHAFAPKQIEAGSDWAGVFPNGYRLGLHKTDGSAWLADEWNTNDLQSLEVIPGYTIYHIPALRDGEFRSTASVFNYSGYGLKVGIRRDGSFRIWAKQQVVWDKNHRTGHYQWFPTDLAVGKETNWLAVAGGNGKVVTLKNDGTLWLWDFTYHNPSRGTDEQRLEREVEKAVPVQLGSHSDWIAISGESDSLIALAADGSLWFWPLGSTDQYYDSADVNGKKPLRPLLDISRKPQRLGNIFGKTE